MTGRSSAGFAAFLLLGQACGSEATSATGDASGDATGTASGVTGEESAASTTVAVDSGSGPDLGESCPDSDLPPPFCHTLLPVSIPDRWAGHLDVLINGERPLVVDDEAAGVIRLVSPSRPEIILAEGPASTSLPDDWWAALSADYNGDGVMDFAAFNPNASGSVSNDLTVAVVDGESFETLGLIPGEEGARDVAAMDVDADGVTELVTIEYLDETMEVRAWRASGGEPDLVASAQGGVGCRANDVFNADFDGDGRKDIVVVWNVGCDAYFLADFDGVPQIATVIAPHSADQALSVVNTPQPGWTSHGGAVTSSGTAVAQLVLIESVEDIRLLEWDRGQFATLEKLAAPRQYEAIAGDVTVGAFAEDGSGGVLFESIVTETGEGRRAAMFFGSNHSFVNDAPFTTSSWVADFNDDGITDFWSEAGLFLSVGAVDD